MKNWIHISLLVMIASLSLPRLCAAQQPEEGAADLPTVVRKKDVPTTMNPNAMRARMVRDTNEAEEPQGSATSSPGVPSTARSTYEYFLSTVVLLFGLLVIFGVLACMWREGRYWETLPTQIIVLALLISAGMFLIAAGYDQDQIAPMMGLLGTVAGYMLGRSSATPVPPSPAATTPAG